MGLFQKKIGPVFLKEDSDADLFIEKMTELSKRAEGTLKKEIEKQVKLASYGVIGEKNIAYELKNSDLDMYILHDLYFEHEGIQAQIDYLIITRKRVYIIECKNLIGNIEIDSSGNFIRTYELFGKKVKEGIYSPITQNERHKLVIKNMRSEGKNKLSLYLFEKNFEDNYKSIVVLSNPKTYLNARFAKKEVKNQVIRADQLVAHIKAMDKAASEGNFSYEQMLELGNYFCIKNNPERSDYTKKYEELLEQVQKVSVNESHEIEETAEEKTCPRCGAKLVLRTAKQGRNAGNQFLGCSAFPKCRYIENL